MARRRREKSQSPSFVEAAVVVAVAAVAAADVVVAAEHSAGVVRIVPGTQWTVPSRGDRAANTGGANGDGETRRRTMVVAEVVMTNPCNRCLRLGHYRCRCCSSFLDYGVDVGVGPGNHCHRASDAPVAVAAAAHSVADTRAVRSRTNRDCRHSESQIGSD
jgi:hypothetical protein